MSEPVHSVHTDCTHSLITVNSNLKYDIDNNTYNEKDELGKNLSDLMIVTLVFAVAFIVLVVACIYVRSKKGASCTGFYCLLALSIVFLLAGIGAGAGAVLIIKNNPIKFIYAISRYITLRTRTDPIMEFTSEIELDIQMFMEGNSDSIIREIEDNLLAKGVEKVTRETRSTFGNQNKNIGSDVNEYGERWRIFSVSVGSLINEEVRALTPTLIKLAEKYPRDVMSIIISILPPKCKINPHRGYSKAVKRFMFGVRIPQDSENCFLCVNGHKQTWGVGKAILWDDTYTHSVKNNTDEERVVVYMDIRRRTDNPWIEKAVDFMQDMVDDSDLVKSEIAETENLIYTQKSNNH
jgi:hypothetical protein